MAAPQDTTSEPLVSVPQQVADTAAPAAAAATLAPNTAPAVVAASSVPQAPRPTPASPAPPRIELPSSLAEYLHNPPPPYPRLSRRLGEQGKVVVRVLIGAHGQAEQAQIHTSSGHERLDQTALTTVLGWRYVPGKRNGVAEAMWFNVPIQFVLE
jgi:periplasmic protein TonB